MRREINKEKGFRNSMNEYELRTELNKTEKENRVVVVVCSVECGQVSFSSLSFLFYGAFFLGKLTGFLTVIEECLVHRLLLH